MSWGEVEKINSWAKKGVPLNHMIWLNDYKTYGKDSYVFQNKDILHELYKSVRISANDNAIRVEALNAIIDNNYPIVGAYFAAINDIKQSSTDVDWGSLTSMEAVLTSDAAITAVQASETAMTVIYSSTSACGKYVANLAGLNPADYSNMAEVAALETAMASVAASEAAMTAVAASETAMAVVTASDIAVAAIIASDTSAKAIDLVIDNYRTILTNTLTKSTRFTKTSKNIYTGVDSPITDGIGTNTIYLPTSIYVQMNGQGNISVYSGVNQSRRILYSTSSSTITSGVSLRGTKVVRGGNSNYNAYPTFDIYTLK